MPSKSSSLSTNNQSKLTRKGKMNSTSLSFFLFTLSLILISASGTVAKKKNLIEDACKVAGQNSAACVAVLHSDPRIVAAKNKKELAKLALELCVRKATEAQNFIKNLAATTHIPALEKCATSHYTYIVASFKSCLGEITQDPQTSNYDARVSGDGAGYCDQELINAHVINPIVSAKNKDMVLLSFVAFAVTNSL